MKSELPEGWTRRTWGEAATLAYGKSLKGRESEGEVPVYGTNGQTGKCGEALCHTRGVIIGRKGAYRGVHYSDRPFWVIDTAFYLEPNTDLVDPLWAYYALLTHDINAMDSGSAIPSTSRSDFYALRCLLPPLDEQQRIAWVLRTLDRQSAAERTLATTARQLADALFRKELVLGARPGWGDATLMDLARFVNGRNFTKAASGTGRPVIRIKELRSGLAPATVWNDVDAHADNVASEDDLLFSWSGTLCVERWPGPEGLVNQHLFKVIPEDGWPGWFVEGWLRHHLERFRHIAASKATTMGHIQRGDLSSAEVRLPDETTLRRFDPVLTTLSRRAGSAIQRAHHAQQLRAALLPRLISGELRVSDTAELGEAVGTARTEVRENDAVPETVTTAAA